MFAGPNNLCWPNPTFSRNGLFDCSWLPELFAEEMFCPNNEVPILFGGFCKLFCGWLFLLLILLLVERIKGFLFILILFGGLNKDLFWFWFAFWLFELLLLILKSPLLLFSPESIALKIFLALLAFPLNKSLNSLSLLLSSLLLSFLWWFNYTFDWGYNNAASLARLQESCE